MVRISIDDVEEKRRKKKVDRVNRRLEFERNSVLVMLCAELSDRQLATDPLNNDSLPNGVGCTVGQKEAPKLPSKVLGQDVVHDSRVVGFDIPIRHWVA
jgi:hypothetical protein